MQDEKYLRQLSKMQRPIPGSSLTNDPESPLPFEQAPEHTNRKKALEEIFMNMTKESVYVPMIEAMERGTSVMEITQMILFEGFRQGKWNPDMFMMLAEPTAYMSMALAERAGVDPVVDYEPDEDTEKTKELTRVEENLKKVKSKLGSKVPAGALPSDIEKKIQELPVPDSLLSVPEEAPEQLPAVEESLLASGGM